MSICSVFLYLFVLWAFAAPAVKLMKMFSWFAGAFSICMCFLKLQRVELSRPPYVTVKMTIFFCEGKKKRKEGRENKSGVWGSKDPGRHSCRERGERVCRLKEMEREWGRLWCSCEGIIWSPMPPKLRHGAWNIYLTQQSAKPETNKKYRQTRSLRGRRWLSKKSLHFLCTHLFLLLKWLGPSHDHFA